MGRAARIGGVFLALVLAHAGAAQAAGDADDGLSAFPPAATIQPDKPSVADRLYPKAAGGFLLVNGNFQSVPSAVARSQADYGVSTVFGVSVSGHPWEKWDYLGYVTAFAGITVPNPGSVGLHEALGFTLVGVYEAVGFKQGQWHDVGWWQCRLQEPPAVPVEPKPWPQV